MSDESTDRGNTKTMALVIKTYFWKSEQLIVQDLFYEILEVTETTSSTLYTKITETFVNDCIPYQKNLIGYASDGAANMSGSVSSVAALLKNDCPNLFTLKCVCHSLALCASYACKEIPYSIEEFCHNVYNYLAHSPLRTSKFNEIQILLELNPLKLLHPSATRWLSLEAVVKRVLDRYEALKIYFGFVNNVDKINTPRVAQIYEALQDPATKIYLSFLDYVLPIVNKINKLFQSETPELPNLLPTVERLLKTVLCNFMLKSYINNLQNLNMVRFVEEYFLSNEMMYVGIGCSKLLKTQLLDRTEVEEIHNRIRNFYICLSKQILKRFDFDDNILKNLKKICPNEMHLSASIIELVECFPQIIDRSKYQETDDEYREVLNLDLKNFNSSNPLSFWSEILNVKTIGGSYAFPNLRQFIPALLVLPHSSAAVERLFSQYNLNKVAIRNRLTTETMRGILSTKSYFKTHPRQRNEPLEITKQLKGRFNKSMYD